MAQGAPVALTQIGLITDDLVIVRDAPRPELDARIRRVPPEQLDLQPQLEVGIGPGGAEKLIAHDLVVQGSADDRALLDSEDSAVAFPAVERLAIENGNRRPFVEALPSGQPGGHRHHKRGQNREDSHR